MYLKSKFVKDKLPAIIEKTRKEWLAKYPHCKKAIDDTAAALLNFAKEGKL